MAPTERILRPSLMLGKRRKAVTIGKEKIAFAGLFGLYNHCQLVGPLKMRVFLVDGIEKLFKALSLVSYFYCFRFAVKRWLPISIKRWLLNSLKRWLPKLWGQDVVEIWGPGVVEIWVILATVLSALALAVGPVPAWLLPFIALRVWEIIIYQANVLLFDPLRAEKQRETYDRHSYRRSLVLAILNYAEILLWFAAVYLVLAYDFAGKPEHIPPNTSGLALYYSVITMSTLGYGDITPASPLTYALATVQPLIGLFFVLIIFSHLVNLLPRPGTKSESERQDADSD